MRFAKKLSETFINELNFYLYYYKMNIIIWYFSTLLVLWLFCYCFTAYHTVKQGIPQGMEREVFTMDIAALSIAMSKSELQTDVGVAMLDKTMEATTELGAGLVKMIDRSMELSVNPNIGSNIDVLV